MNPLQSLASLGQSPWLDFISRASLESGQIKNLMDQGILGVTSNPAIFEQAIARSSDYDQDIETLARQGHNSFEIYDKLSIEDVKAAADLFLPVYERTDGVDGYVSLEVSPFLATDTEKTIEEGRRLWKELGRPNVMIKVPATLEGIPAIEALIGDGIHVNVTLLFSLERYRMAAEAYINGLQRLAAKGRSLKVASVASFFVSRLDTLVDPRLPEDFRSKSAIALSHCAYEMWQEIFGEGFDELRAEGARTQRLLWASTSTKNPELDPIMYVEALVGAETVDTIPLATVEAYLAAGNPQAVLPGAIPASKEMVKRIEGMGLNFEDAADTLEREGIEKFVQPFEKLLASIEAKRSLVQG